MGSVHGNATKARLRGVGAKHAHMPGACHVSFGSATSIPPLAGPRQLQVRNITVLHSCEDLRAALHSPCGFVSTPACLEPPNSHLSFLGGYAGNSSTFPITDFPHLVAVDTEYPIYYCFYRSPRPPLIRHTAIESCLYLKGGRTAEERARARPDRPDPLSLYNIDYCEGPSRRRVGGRDEDKPG